MRKFAISALVVSSMFAVGCATEGIDSGSDAPAEVAESESAFGFALPPGHDIPVTGYANPAFKPVDDAIRRFMSERCIGGAVVGVSLGGNVVHNRGYGYKSGPPSPSCATANDPFIGGAKVEPNTPFRIGSNSKAVLAAILRKELKAALSAKRGVPVSDADLQNLKLLNSEIELVSPEVRAKMLAGGNIDGFTSQPCAVVNGWSKVTLGHLLTHTAGFESSETAYDELSAMRGITSATAAAFQEQQSGAPAAAKTALKTAEGQNAYFVTRANLEEVARAQGNRCFRAEPGATTEYSNAGFTMLNYVLERVTGKTLSAASGYPGTHVFSLLAKHMQQDFGFTSGIELSHAVLGARDVAEPRYRAWSSSTYYPVVVDEKRPFCLLSGGRCDFSRFMDEKSRFDWNWKNQKVDFTYASNQVAPGIGSLAAEAPRYLAFMEKYTVGAPYGVDRSTLPGTAFHQHWGGLSGTRSWVAQFAGKTVNYEAFAQNPDGTQNYDYAKSTPGSCVIPKGANFFFAMNQSADPKCTVASGCKSLCKNDACLDEEKQDFYGRYEQVLKGALCKSTWTLPPQ